MFLGIHIWCRLRVLLRPLAVGMICYAMLVDKLVCNFVLRLVLFACIVPLTSGDCLVYSFL